jgi:hypothetical protein
MPRNVFREPVTERHSFYTISAHDVTNIKNEIINDLDKFVAISNDIGREAPYTVGFDWVIWGDEKLVYHTHRLRAICGSTNYDGAHRGSTGGRPYAIAALKIKDEFIPPVRHLNKSFGGEAEAARIMND